MSFHRFAKPGETRWMAAGKPSAEVALEYFLAVRDKIDRDHRACWEWPGQKRHGYGIIQFDGYGALYSVHRLSFKFAKGRIPYGLEVMHDCDNRACFNPNHLFLGTHSDNMQDMVRKGRHRGGPNQHPKLPELRRTPEAEAVLNADRKRREKGKRL